MFGNKGNIDMIKMRPKIVRIFVGERNESRASFPRMFYPPVNHLLAVLTAHL